MALAPVPGVGKRQTAERSGMRITLGGRTVTLHLADLGPQDDLVARKETGLPVTPYFAEDRFGMDSLLIVYWMARRKNGEPNLRFQHVLDEFPTYNSINESGFSIEALEELSEEDAKEEADSDPLS